MMIPTAFAGELMVARAMPVADPLMLSKDKRYELALRLAFGIRVCGLSPSQFHGCSCRVPVCINTRPRITRGGINSNRKRPGSELAVR
jgi:hypothetical protein